MPRQPESTAPICLPAYGAARRCRGTITPRHNGCPIRIIAGGGDSKQEIVGIKVVERAIGPKNRTTRRAAASLDAWGMRHTFKAAIAAVVAELADAPA